MKFLLLLLTTTFVSKAALDSNPIPDVVPESNQPIATLEAVKFGCGLRAPEAIPEPSSSLLASLAGSLLLLLRRRCY